MTQRRSRWSVALILVVLALGCWRIPALRRSATHRSELAAILHHRVPEVFAPGDPAIPTVYYLYAETCPYCSIDRAKVREASIASGARFVGLRVGPSLEGDHYWRSTGLPMPDTLVQMQWDEVEPLGVAGVPVIFLAAHGILEAAWVGHLRWELADLTRAFRCRSGTETACVSLYLSDVGHAIRYRFSLFSGGLGAPDGEAVTVPGE